MEVSEVPVATYGKFFDDQQTSCGSKASEQNKAQSVYVKFRFPVEVTSVKYYLNPSVESERMFVYFLQIKTSLTGGEGTAAANYGDIAEKLRASAFSCNWHKTNTMWQPANAPAVVNATYVIIYNQAIQSATSILPLCIGLNYGASAMYGCEMRVFANVVDRAGYFYDYTTSLAQPCTPGYYCPGLTFFREARQLPCPAGTFGASEGLSDVTQCANCVHGVECPMATATPRICSGSNEYCRSGTAFQVQYGYYSVAEDQLRPTARTTELPCEAGYTCTNGVRSLCPAGTFGATPRMTQASCTAPCAGGYRCAAGSTTAKGATVADPTEKRCNKSGFLCPPGSADYVALTVGHYVTNDRGEMSWDGALSQVPCPPGTYCTGGVRRPCPAGRYGATSHLSTMGCTAACPQGYLCPEGATDYALYECPAGHYCEGEGALEPTPCPRGTYRSALRGTWAGDCTPCPANYYNPSLGGVSFATACLPCVAPATSQEGSSACAPGVLSFAALDPAPVRGGISDGDEVEIRFSGPATEKPGVVLDTTEAILQAVQFSSRIGYSLSTRWRDGGLTLVVRIVDVEDPLGVGEAVDPAATRPGFLQARVMADKFVDAATRTVAVPASQWAVVNGTWGLASQPKLLAAVAIDGSAPEGRTVGGALGAGHADWLPASGAPPALPLPKAGDRLVLMFDNSLATVDVSSRAAVDALLRWSTPLHAGYAYSGAWSSDDSTLTVTLTQQPSAGALAPTLAAVAAWTPGVLRVSVRDDVVELRSADRSSLPSNDSVVVSGAWALGPASSAAVLSHSPCSLTVQWREPDAAALRLQGITFVGTMVRWCRAWGGGLAADAAATGAAAVAAATAPACSEALVPAVQQQQQQQQALQTLTLLPSEDVPLGARGYAPACNTRRADAAAGLAQSVGAARARVAVVATAPRVRYEFAHPQTGETQVLADQVGAYWGAVWADPAPPMDGVRDEASLVAWMDEDAADAAVPGAAQWQADGLAPPASGAGGSAVRSWDPDDASVLPALRPACVCRALPSITALSAGVFGDEEAAAEAGEDASGLRGSVSAASARPASPAQLAAAFGGAGASCDPGAAQPAGLACVCVATSSVEPGAASLLAGGVGDDDSAGAATARMGSLLAGEACRAQGVAPLPPRLASVRGATVPIELDTMGGQVISFRGSGLGRALPSSSGSWAASAAAALEAAVAARAADAASKTPAVAGEAGVVLFEGLSRGARAFQTSPKVSLAPLGAVLALDGTGPLPAPSAAAAMLARLEPFSPATMPVASPGGTGARSHVVPSADRLRWLLARAAQAEQGGEEEAAPFHAAGLASARYAWALRGCALLAPNTQVACTTPTGVGRDLEPVLWVAGFPVLPPRDLSAAPPAAPVEVPEDYANAAAAFAGSNALKARVLAEGSGLCQWDSRLCASFLRPTISDFRGDGAADAATEGEQVVVLQGRMLGVQEDEPELVAVYSPAQAPDRLFHASNCTFLKPHEQLQCETAQGAGEELAWTVIVGGQPSRIPTTDYRPPSIRGVRVYVPPWGPWAPPPALQPSEAARAQDSPALFARFPPADYDWLLPSPADAAYRPPASLAQLSTQGAEWLEIDGDDFGPDITFVTRVELVPSDASSASSAASSSSSSSSSSMTVVLHVGNGSFQSLTDPSRWPQYSAQAKNASASAADQSERVGCVMATPHRRLLCRTRAGAGEGLEVQVTVLRQTGARSEQQVSFAAPVIRVQDVFVQFGDERAAASVRVPSEGLRPYGGELVVGCDNLPPDASMVRVEYAGLVQSTFQLMFGAQQVLFTPPALDTRASAGRVVSLGESGEREVSVLVRVLSRPSQAVSIRLRRPTVQGYDANSALRNMTATAQDSSVGLRDRLVEVKGTSFGSDRSTVVVSIGDAPCRVLSEQALQLHIVSTSRPAAADAHVRSFCWSSSDRGTVSFLMGSVAAVGVPFFDIDTILAPPSPAEVGLVAGVGGFEAGASVPQPPLDAAGAQALALGGGSNLTVRGSGLDSSFGTAVWLVKLNSSSALYDPQDARGTARVAVSMGLTQPSASFEFLATRALLGLDDSVSALDARALALVEGSQGLLVAALPCPIVRRPSALARESGQAADPCPWLAASVRASADPEADTECVEPRELICTVPAGGLGGGWQVAVVTGTAVGATSIAAGFAAPALAASDPAEAPTYGGGTLQLRGSGLGADARVPLLLRNWLGAAKRVTVNGRECPATAWSDAAVNCTLPAGSAGALTAVELRVGELGALASLPPALFHYAPPSLAPVSVRTYPFPRQVGGLGGTVWQGPQDGDAALAAAIDAASDSAAAAVLDGGALFEYSSEGREFLVLVGDNFGAAPAVRLRFDPATVALTSLQFNRAVAASAPCAVDEALSAAAAEALRAQWLLEDDEEDEETRRVLAASVAPWRHRVLVCRVPSGGGRNVTVELVASASVWAVAPFRLAYAAPRIASVRVDSAPYDSLLAAPPRDASGPWAPPDVGARKSLEATVAGARPASGRFLLHVAGSSFTELPTVTVGGQPCSIVWGVPDASRPGGLWYALGRSAVPHDAALEAAGVAAWSAAGLAGAVTSRAAWFAGHTAVTCVAPRGVGRHAPVRVQGMGQTATDASFSFDRPALESVAPAWIALSSGSAAGGATVQLTGRNFGDDVHPTSSAALPDEFAAAAAAAEAQGLLKATGVSLVNVSVAVWASRSAGPRNPDGSAPTSADDVAAVVARLGRTRAACAAAAVRSPNEILQCDVSQALPAGLGLLRVDVAGQQSDMRGVALLCPSDTYTLRVGDAADLPADATDDNGSGASGGSGGGGGGGGGVLTAPCAPCPAGALCPGGFMDPLPRANFFKLSRTAFLECKPHVACPGFEGRFAPFSFQNLGLGFSLPSADASAAAAADDELGSPATRRLLAVERGLALRRALGRARARRAVQTDGAQAREDEAVVRRIIGDALDGMDVDLALLSIQDAYRVKEVVSTWEAVEAGVYSLFAYNSSVAEQWRASRETNLESAMQQCASEYSGERCSECAARHYRLEERCLPCPDLAWLYMVLFFVAIMALLAFGWYLNRRQVNLAGLSIGIDFLQAVSMFAAYGFEWPVEMRWVFTVTSSANLNLQILAPECTISFTYEERFFAMASLPVGLFALSLFGLLLLYTSIHVRRCWRAFVRWRMRRTADASSTIATTPPRSTSQRALLALDDVDSPAPSQRQSRSREEQDEADRENENEPKPLDMVLGVLFSLLYYLYLQVVRNALSVFDCTPSINSDGTEGVRTMDAEPSIVCDASLDPVYARLLPWGIITLAVYGGGIPLLFGVVLWTNRTKIKVDQTLRARGEGTTYSTNPAFSVRRRFGKLYEDYKPDLTYWRLVLLLRKFLLVYTTTLFGRFALFQGSISVLILFAAYALHHRFAPFLSSSAVPKAFLDLADEVPATAAAADGAGGKLGSKGDDLLDGFAGSAPMAALPTAGRARRKSMGPPPLDKKRSSQAAAAAAAAGSRDEMPLWLRVLRAISPVAVLMCSAQSHRRVRGGGGARRASLARRGSLRQAGANNALLPDPSAAGCMRRLWDNTCGDCVADCCDFGERAPVGVRSLDEERDEYRRLAVIAKESSVSFVFEYNQLESSFLTSALFILLGGMVFSSSALERGTIGYTVLLVLLSVIVVSATLSFLYMIIFELYRSLRYAYVFAKAREYEERARRETVELQRSMSKIDKLFRSKVPPSAASSSSRSASARHASELEVTSPLFRRSSSGSGPSPSPSPTSSGRVQLSTIVGLQVMAGRLRKDDHPPASDGDQGAGVGGGTDGVTKRKKSDGSMIWANPMLSARKSAREARGETLLVNPLAKSTEARINRAASAVRAFASQREERIRRGSIAVDAPIDSHALSKALSTRRDSLRLSAGSPPSVAAAAGQGEGGEGGSSTTSSRRSSVDGGGDERAEGQDAAAGAGPSRKPPETGEETFILRRAARKAVFRHGLSSIPDDRALPLSRKATRRRALEVASVAAKRLMSAVRPSDDTPSAAPAAAAPATAAAAAAAPPQLPPTRAGRSWASLRAATLQGDAGTLS